MKHKLPEAIVFDFDDTIYEYGAANRYAEAELLRFIRIETSLDAEQISNAYKEARIEVKKKLGDTGSSHSRILYINEMFRILHLNPRPSFLLKAEQIFWSKYMQQMKLRPGFQEFLATVRHLKIKLILVSDLTLQVQLKKLLALGLDSAFDEIYVSEELGGDKVTGIPIKHLKHRFAVYKSIWFIGDKPHDFLEVSLENTFFIFGNDFSDVRESTQKISSFQELNKMILKLS